MTQKAMGNVQKLSMIFTAIRESLAVMLDGDKDVLSLGVSYTVMPIDVMAAWDILQQSRHTFAHFKVRNLLSNELT